MAKQPIIPRFENHTRPEIPAKSNNGFARPEAVARALGYSDREQAIAKDILGQFVWRYAAPSETTVTQASPVRSPEEDASSREEDERDLDDLKAAS